MFTLLFGIHFAIRALIEWVTGDDRPDDRVQNDLDTEFADHQNATRYEYSPVTIDRKVKDKSCEVETDIFVRNSNMEGNRFLPKYKIQKDECHIESKFNKSNSSIEGKDVPIVEKNFTSQKADGTEKDKIIDSGIAESIIPVQTERLSAEVTIKQEVRVPNEDARSSWKQTMPDMNGTDIEKMIIPMKDIKLSTVDTEQDAQKPIDVTRVYGYEQMPYLYDNNTINYMFIMRGLPGSGKSTIVKCLQEVYRGLVVVCSADDYFYDDDGNYNFDASKLSEAHKYCQDKAGYHCDNDTPVVIIDNTNIQRWAMSYYMKLAQKDSYYHVVIVEPLTPWRYDINELALRNKHDVDRDLISKKLKSLTDNVYRPLYYGWFICKKDSSLLVRKSREVLKQCLDEILWPDLNTEDVSDSFASLEEISSNVVICYTDPVPMLHCTAAYLARRSKDAYHTEEHVMQSIGKAFSLRISGFVYSKQAISARVNLTQCTNDMIRNEPKLSKLVDESPWTAGAESSVINDISLLEKLYMKSEEEILRDRYSDVHLHSPDSQKKHSLFQHGCSAHITISYANDGQSKLSGENLLNILELEFYGKVKQKKTKVGVVSAYGNNMFQVQLKEPIEVVSLFHGFYGSRG